MGFFSSPLSALVKIALTPVAVAADAIKIVTGNEPDTTKALINSATDDVEDFFEGRD